MRIKDNLTKNQEKKDKRNGPMRAVVMYPSPQ